MAGIQSFEELKVWQKSRILCQKVFVLTQQGLFAKDFALKDQINRSSGSVMDNIAEGFGRTGTNEFISFLSIANGSLLEVRSQLIRALDRQYIQHDEYEEIYKLTEEIQKMTYSLIAYLNKTDFRGLKFKERINQPERPRTKN